MKLQLSKHKKVDFSQKREALTIEEAQDQIINKLLDLSLLSLQMLTLQSSGTIIKSTNSVKLPGKI